MKDYYVVAHYPAGHQMTVCGLGKNKGTLDTALSKRSAQKYAKELSRRPVWNGVAMKVESQIAGEVFGVYQNGNKIA